LNQNGALVFCFDAFSSREPVPTSLENALSRALAGARSGVTGHLASQIICCAAQAAMLLRNPMAALIADPKMHAGTGNGRSGDGFSPDQFFVREKTQC
jgi:hypothetical protein